MSALLRKVNSDSTLTELPLDGAEARYGTSRGLPIVGTPAVAGLGAAAAGLGAAGATMAAAAGDGGDGGGGSE